MKFDSEVFKVFNGEYDGELDEVIFKLVRKTDDGKRFLKFLETLIKEENESGDEPRIKKMLELDHLLGAYQCTCMDFGLTVGFILGKHFDITRKEALQEYARIEKLLKSKLGFWSKEDRKEGL